MPRNNGIYSPPPGTGGTPQTVISSTMFNAWVADITADQNNPRPIIAGGTGSATSQGAIDAFFGAPRTIVDERLLFVDPSDPTKQVRLDAGNVTAGQTRVVSVPDSNVDLGDISTKLPLAGGTMSGLLTLAPADDDPDGTASLNIPAGADAPDVQADGDLWADSSEDLRYRRGGEDATVYDTVSLPRPAPGEMAAGTETAPRAMSAADVRQTPGAAKAWVNFNGTGTVAIRGSFNVTSITDNGTGDYTVNLATSMTSANYAVSLSANGIPADDGGTAGAAKTVSAFRFSVVNIANNRVDVTNVNATVFGG